MVKKLNLLNQLLSPGGGIERIVRQRLEKTKKRVIKEYDRTSVGVHKRPHDIRRSGEKGRLRKSLVDAEIIINWEGNNTLVGLLRVKNPPAYIRTQEYGVKSKWVQRFLIVGQRKPDRPSKRGDLYILGNIRKDQEVPKEFKVFPMAVEHKEGVKNRLFLHSGRSYLKGQGRSETFKAIRRLVREKGK